MKKITTFAAILVVSANVSWAAGVGTAGAQFLKVRVGARALAMGGAYGAISEGSDAIYWNPAGLAMMEKREVSVSYNKYIQDTTHGFLSYGHPLGERGTLGGAITYLGTKDIEKRSGDTDTADGIFNTGDMSAAVAFGRKIGNRFALGMSLKYIRSDLELEKATAFGTDLGLLYNTPLEGLAAGLAVQNIGTKLKFRSEGDPLPLNIKTGLAYRMMEGRLLMASDVDIEAIDKKIFPQLGVEYVAAPMMALRAGYRFNEDSDGLTGLGAGMGLRLGTIGLDYAFVPFGELGDTHRITLAMRF